MLQNHHIFRKYIYITLFLLMLSTRCNKHIEISNQESENRRLASYTIT